MAITQIYKVLYNNISIRSKASLFAYSFRRLKHDTLIDILDIDVL